VTDAARGPVDRLAAFAGRPAASLLVAAWAAVEAIVLPIVPDVGAAALVLASPRHVARMLAAVVIGAVFGSLLLAGLFATAPGAVRDLILAVPGVDGFLLEAARTDLERAGVLGFTQLGPGPPLKTYSLEWLALGGSAPGLVAGAIVNRISRIGPVLLAAAVLGWAFGGPIRRHPAATALAYAAFWVGVYAYTFG
jgi:hypothetical protein